MPCDKPWLRHQPSKKPKSRYSEKEYVSRKERIKTYVKKQREMAIKIAKEIKKMNENEPKKKTPMYISDVKLKFTYECPRRSCLYKTTKRSEMLAHIRKTGHTTYKQLPKSKSKFIE